MSLTSVYTHVTTTIITIGNIFLWCQSCLVPDPGYYSSAYNHYISESPFPRISYKWSRIVCGLLGLALFPGRNAFEMLPWFCMYNSGSFLLLSSIPWYGYNSICLTVRSKTSGLFTVRQLWTFMDRFLCECKFPFLWPPCPRVQLLNHIIVRWLVF